MLIAFTTVTPGADLEMFQRGGPEAIIYKTLERGGPKSLKMAFECSFQLFSYKSFANIPPKGGGVGHSPNSATVCNSLNGNNNVTYCI